MWATTLLVLILKVTPAQAASMMIWVGVAGFAGRPGLLLRQRTRSAGGRRGSSSAWAAASSCACLAGFYYAGMIGDVSMFWLFVMIQRFFGDGALCNHRPLFGRDLARRCSASGMGFGYGLGNLGKVIGPLGLALICGSANFVSPKASLDFIVPARAFPGLLVVPAVGDRVSVRHREPRAARSRRSTST